MRHYVPLPARQYDADARAALVSGAASLAADPLPVDDWHAEHLAEMAQRDADDRQQDFFDGDGPDFD